VPMFWMERRWGSKDKETQTLHVGLLVDLIGQQGQRNAKAACGGTVKYTIMYRVGQNCISAPYMTVCMVISLLITPYVHRIYL
jgi:hypothetical protein